MSNKSNDNNDYDQLNALVDGELNEREREALLARIDNEPELRGELCDIHRVKDLLGFAYPLRSQQDEVAGIRRFGMGAIAASLLMVLALGFVSGYATFNQWGIKNQVTSSTQKAEKNVSSIIINQQEQEKVIIYLGSSKKEKFQETLDKAESLLTKYKTEGAKVYVVTSAGGIDLLRTANTEVNKRIKTMSVLYKGLHFVACNNQIYELHKKGQDVNLVKEAEIAPSAVQFVVDHLNKGWKYIAI